MSLAIGWALLILARNPQVPFTSRFQCGSDPRDFLRIGDMMEPSSPRFVVDAHCADARYPRADGSSFATASRRG